MNSVEESRYCILMILQWCCTLHILLGPEFLTISVPLKISREEKPMGWTDQKACLRRRKAGHIENLG